MRAIILLLSAAIALCALDPEPRADLHSELTSTLEELRNRVVLMSPTLHDIGIPLPAEVDAVLSKQCLQGGNLLKRIADPSAEFPTKEYIDFHKDIVGLLNRLDAVRDVIEDYGWATRNHRNEKATADFIRYRDLVRSRVTRLFMVIADDARNVDDPERVAKEREEERQFSGRREYHEKALSYASPHRLVHSVPKDEPALREYVDNCTAIRAAIGIAVQKDVFPPANAEEIEALVRISRLLDSWLWLIYHCKLRLQGRAIPSDSALSSSYEAAVAAEEQSLRAQIAHQRARIAAMEEFREREGQLESVYYQREHLRKLTEDALETDLSIIERHQHLDALMMGSPQVLRDQIAARMAEFTRQRTTTVASLTEALASGTVADARYASTALKILLREVESFVEECAQAREREEWHARAGDPRVAPVLTRLDAAWNAMTAARALRLEGDRERLRAGLAGEPVAEEETLSRREMERAREALELCRQQVLSALGPPRPRSRGDSK